MLLFKLLTGKCWLAPLTFCQTNTVMSTYAYKTLHRSNSNKAGLFEGSFFWGGGEGQFEPPPFIFQEELVSYQYNFIQLLTNLFKVC